MIGQADEYEEHIGHLIAQLGFGVSGVFRFFKRLFAVQAGHQAGHFSYLFHEDGRVGQFVIITYSDGVDPLVDGLLRFL